MRRPPAVPSIAVAARAQKRFLAPQKRAVDHAMCDFERSRRQCARARLRMAPAPRAHSRMTPDLWQSNDDPLVRLVEGQAPMSERCPTLARPGVFCAVPAASAPSNVEEPSKRSGGALAPQG